MNIRSIVRIFESGNVSISGLRGRGKDMLTANVIVRRKLPYISNVDYGGQWYPLELEKLDCGRNTFENYITGNINYYEYPYPDGTDVYVSDAGILFPAQYCNQLNNKYPFISTFSAIDRQVGLCNFHTNAQYLGRVYDKIREQSDIYIRCDACKVFFHKIVIQKITIYDKYESALNAVPQFHLPLHYFLINGMDRYFIEKQRYLISYGKIKSHTLIYWNRSKYDTRLFKEMLKNGKKNP